MDSFAPLFIKLETRNEPPISPLAVQSTLGHSPGRYLEGFMEEADPAVLEPFARSQRLRRYGQGTRQHR